MMCRSPHVNPSPRPSSPYRLPMNTPDSADCASSVPLGNVTGIASAGLLLDLKACAGRCEILRIDGDPTPVLHLLHAHQVVAVVAGSIEAELALDRVDPVVLDV